MGWTREKLKYNLREREVQEQGLRDGWKIFSKGWPDFLFYKEENNKFEAFFVEVKRKPYKNMSKTIFDVELSPEQKELFSVLEKMGLKIKIIYKE